MPGRNTSLCAATSFIKSSMVFSSGQSWGRRLGSNENISPFSLARRSSRRVAARVLSDRAGKMPVMCSTL